MQGPLFFDETASLAAVSVGDVLTVSGDEAHHAVAVKRVRPGEQVHVGDGVGLVVSGTVVETGKRSLSVRVTASHRHNGDNFRLTLVQALAKGGRDELAIQAATEVGVDAVVPWAASRSVAKWDAKKQVTGVERWRGIVREAAKQSLRPTVPSVAELVTTTELCELIAASDRALVLDPQATERLSGVSLPAEGNLLLIVGPEGGIEPAEFECFTEAGASRVLLGDTVLRTSSAGIASLALLNASLGRW